MFVSLRFISNYDRYVSIPFVFSHLLLLQVGDELCVQDGVTVLDIIDRVESQDCADREDDQGDWEPDGSLLPSELTGVGNIDGRGWRWLWIRSHS